MKRSATACLIVLVIALFASESSGQTDSQRRTITTTTTTTTTTERAQLVDSNGTPRNCICLTTSEFNPVCGSNGVTYGSKTKLECGQRCGHNVELLYYGQCVM
ncbi:uncharacterized protein [Anabrus simplex]|uniref:uncharacterized protein n=1 Tax=Anabrus simplex TaxID=316456 RepID=UPI0035A2E11A